MKHWKICRFLLLLLQVKHERENLLSHPLVQSLIYAKWRKFGRAIYYSKLFLFILFLFFLTGYTALSTPLNPNYQNVNGTKICVSSPIPDTLLVNIFVKAGKVYIVTLAIFQLLFEVLTFCFRFYLLVSCELRKDFFYTSRSVHDLRLWSCKFTAL